MCFDYDALPPDLPEGARSGGPESGVALTQQLTLTSQDGTQFSAYLARPTTPNGAGIVILPDVRGLFRFYEDLAQRFAQAGVEAIAIDYFGRTAGIGERDATFDYMPHVRQTNADQIAQDANVAINHLRGLSPAPRAIFTVGFCFGGSNSLQQAANHQGLAGVIAFYGHPTAARAGAPAAIDRIGDFSCPVLGLYGGADQGIPVEEVQRFDNALSEAGIEHEIVVYANAPHSFFDRTFDTYQQECADAWMRMLTFISAHISSS